MKGTLYGPYAKQVTGTKLKFWFCLDEDERYLRYEVHVDTFERKPKARHRPIHMGKVPTHTSNFNDYLIPDEIEDYPSLIFPRFKRDRLPDAAMTLLTPEDFADIVRVRMIGKLPQSPIVAHYGERPCTSAQLL